MGRVGGGQDSRWRALGPGRHFRAVRDAEHGSGAPGTGDPSRAAAAANHDPGRSDAGAGSSPLAAPLTSKQSHIEMLEQKPLQGIRVLDLSRVLAGPYCTMNLADLGAEVIKLELPGHGDDARRFAPLLPGSTDSGYFYSVNRGKQSVTLDLRTEDGRAIFLELTARADVVVENFSPGTMERFQLGYPALNAVNPKIILCSISGFGQTGPMAALPAYDIVAQALGGTISITGHAGG